MCCVVSTDNVKHLCTKRQFICEVCNGGCVSVRPNWVWGLYLLSTAYVKAFLGVKKNTLDQQHLCKF